MQFDIVGETVDVYQSGTNLTQTLTDALLSSGFFTLDISYVSIIADPERKQELLIGLVSAFLAVFILTATFTYFGLSWQARRPPPAAVAPLPWEPLELGGQQQQAQAPAGLRRWRPGAV